MLYLFGRLALSDSLTYHEDFFMPELAPARAQPAGRGKATPAARAAAIDRRLRRGRHFPQANRAARCAGRHHFLAALRQLPLATPPRPPAPAAARAGG